MVKKKHMLENSKRWHKLEYKNTRINWNWIAIGKVLLQAILLNSLKAACLCLVGQEFKELTTIALGHNHLRYSICWSVNTAFGKKNIARSLETDFGHENHIPKKHQ